ncbi:hypothetical protein BDR06DRAFT_962018 [Suillus hirtellus]|nr:hypothetical protein BDR06DRAFT_962018 [Suillus hirtellus]
MWALAALLLAGPVRAAIPNAMLRGMPSLPKLPLPDRYRFITSQNGTVLPPITTVYYFDQLMDHNNPDLGTFQQRYWMNWEFYEPGGPIILWTPGEDPGDDSMVFATNETINGLIAQQQNGAVIIIEHRFFGYSNPYDNLTSQSLALLTIQQAIDDLEYFAKTADLPMPGGDAVKPGQAPWILSGGSYSGALTSWTMVNKPGLFWAAYASSAVVEAITYFCDALEVKNGVSAGPEGWGLENAIKSWGNFWNTTYYDDICGSEDAETCWGTYNTSQPYWTNVTVNNAGRSWFWMVCNQVGWYQVGPPEGQPAIVSRILQPINEQRLCVNMFPQAFTYPPQPNTAQINAMYTGWNVNVPRLFFANGLRDPWREATVSADGLNKPDNPSMPIYEGDGFHGSDFFTKNGIVDPTVAVVQEAALRYMKEWLAEWRPST